MEVMVKLTDIFRDVFNDDEIEIFPAMTANDIDGWDSFAHMALIGSIEVAFGIQILDNEVVAIKNVGDIVRLITSKLEKL